MNANVHKLRDLASDLEAVRRNHEDILAHEPLIQKPLDQAVEAARQRWSQVGGDVIPKQHPLGGVSNGD